MRNYYLYFDNMRRIASTKYTVFDRLVVNETDEQFVMLDQMLYLFPMPSFDTTDVEQMQQTLLDCWLPVIEGLLKRMDIVRRLVFLNEHQKTVFCTIKGKLRLHMNTIDLTDLQPYHWQWDLTECNTANEVLLWMIRTDKEHNALGVSMLESSTKSTSMEDGTLPLVMPRTSKGKAAKTPKPTAITASRHNVPLSTKAEIIKRQIELICMEYGMHAEVKAGVAYVTTVAGEWYFAYNDRPITLRHKNSEKRFRRDGTTTGKYHVQDVRFYSPLSVLSYIKRHEDAEIKRQMSMNMDCVSVP